MIETKFTMSTGEEIFIYDNVFNSKEAYNIQRVAESSFFRLGSKSSPSVNSKQTTFFQSYYTSEDISLLKLNNSTNFISIVRKHGCEDMSVKAWVNATTHLTDYNFHIDEDKLNSKTLLYYTNDTWSQEWGGETIFKNSNNEVEIAVSCKPNRVVLFDSAISHKPTNLSIKSDLYRFIFVMQFKPNQES
jgi:Rps23 Pro-64 3,4-dihydroxylase Tpa1-like proline 4-hydroxylase